MSEERVKEIQEFVENFNKKMKEAYCLYEEKQKKSKNLKKCYSQMNNRRKTEGDMLPPVQKVINKIIPRYSSNKNLFIKPPDWKPGRGVPDYFEEFKGLKHQLQLNSWEKVRKYNI